MMGGGLNSLSSSGDIDAADTKKRSRDLRDDEGYLSPEDLSKLSHPERKKHREKKRRREATKGFDDLMNLLIEIDPKVRIEVDERDRRGQRKESIGAQEDSLLTRVETITRTVDAFRRVHRENEERKVIIMELTRGGSGVGLGGRTAVMNDEVTRMFSMTTRNPSTESLTHRSLEHSTLFQHAGLEQAAMTDSGAAAAALLTQRSLNPFGVDSSSIPPWNFLALQGLGAIAGSSEVLLNLSSIMGERNRATMSQTYLRMLQDEAANAAATTAAAALQFRTGVQMGFTGLPRQPEESGRGMPDGRDGRRL